MRLFQGGKKSDAKKKKKITLYLSHAFICFYSHCHLNDTNTHTKSHTRLTPRHIQLSEKTSLDQSKPTLHFTSGQLQGADKCAANVHEHGMPQLSQQKDNKDTFTDCIYRPTCIVVNSPWDPQAMHTKAYVTHSALNIVNSTLRAVFISFNSLQDGVNQYCTGLGLSHNVNRETCRLMQNASAWLSVLIMKGENKWVGSSGHLVDMAR